MNESFDLVRVCGVIIGCAALLSLLPATARSEAGGVCRVCGGRICADGEWQEVERTIYVPKMVNERRTVNVTEFHCETRQRTVMIRKCVPETRQVRETYVVMVPETRVRTEKYCVQRPVWREEERNITVQVPRWEVRQATRQVCRKVQVQEMRTVSCDQGHWEHVPCDHGCAPEWGCPVGGCRVWRPHIVTKEVPVTVCRDEVSEEPYEYKVAVYTPEVRTHRVRVCDYVTEERSHEVEFTVCTPRQRERVRNVTSYREVDEPQVQDYTVKVPRTVSREIDVPVCKMVPKRIVQRIPPCCCGAPCAP